MITNVYHKILGRSADDWWHRTYLLDWFIGIVFLIIVGIVSFSVSPRERYLPNGDTSVTYPVKPDIVPDWLLLVISILGPITVFLLFQIGWRSRHDVLNALLGLLVALSITLLITGCLKVGVGRYRPDYEGRIGQKDAQMSFPSGHASTSFSAMVFLALYMGGKLRVFVDHSGLTLLKGLSSILPLAVCIGIAVSRVIDYHHHFSDIIAGALLGSGTAMFAYFLYFPSLWEDSCDLPRNKYQFTTSPRTPRLDTV